MFLKSFNDDLLPVVQHISVKLASSKVCALSATFRAAKKTYAATNLA